MPKLSELTEREEFKKLPPDAQARVRQKFFDKHIASDQKFLALPDDAKARVRSKALGSPLQQGPDPLTKVLTDISRPGAAVRAGIRAGLEPSTPMQELLPILKAKPIAEAVKEGFQQPGTPGTELFQDTYIKGAQERMLQESLTKGHRPLPSLQSTIVSPATSLARVLPRRNDNKLPNIVDFVAEGMGPSVGGFVVDTLTDPVSLAMTLLAGPAGKAVSAIPVGRTTVGALSRVPFGEIGQLVRTGAQSTRYPVPALVKEVSGTLQELNMAKLQHGELIRPEPTPQAMKSIQHVSKVSQLAPTTQVKAELSGSTEALLRSAGAARPRQNPSAMKGLQKFLSTTGTRIKKLGPDGDELVTQLNLMSDDAGISAGEATWSYMQNTARLSAAEKTAVRRMLDGRAPVQGSPKLIDATNRLRQQLDGVARVLEQMGFSVQDPKSGALRPFEARANFFPRFLKRGMLEPDSANFKRAVNHLVSTNQAKDIDDAVRILSRVNEDIDPRTLSTGTRLAKRFGNIEFGRVIDLPEDFYLQNLDEVLPLYFDQAFRRISSAARFGFKGEKIDELTGRIAAQFGEAEGDFARNVAREFIGIGKGQDIDMQALSGMLSSAQVVTKLGLGQIPQIGQLVVNNSVRSGMFNTMKALKNIRMSNELAIRSGAITKLAVQDAIANLYGLNEVTTSGRVAGGFLNLIGFTAADIQARAVGAGAGALESTRLAGKLLSRPTSKFLRRRLTQFGLDPDAIIAQRGMTQRDILTAARRASFDANFRSSILDLPEVIASKNPITKLITQFKSFGFQQTSQITNFAVKEAAQGNMMPLFNLLAAGQVMGEVIADLKSALRGRERPGFGEPARYIENYAATATFGLWLDMFESSRFGEQGVLGFFVGPTGSDIAGFLSSAMSKSPARNLAKEATRLLPVVGPYTARQLFPRKQRKQQNPLGSLDLGGLNL